MRDINALGNAGLFSVMMSHGNPKVENTRAVKFLRVVSIVVSSTVMYKLNLVNAQTATRMLVYLPERPGQRTLVIQMNDFDGREGEATGSTGALAKGRVRTPLQTEHA